MEKEYRKRIDFSDKGAKKLWNYDEKGVSKLIATMPMTKWSGSSKGLVSYENDQFRLNLDVDKEVKIYYSNGQKKFVNTAFIIILSGRLKILVSNSGPEDFWFESKLF